MQWSNTHTNPLELCTPPSPYHLAKDPVPYPPAGMMGLSQLKTMSLHVPLLTTYLSTYTFLINKTCHRTQAHLPKSDS